MPVSQSPAEVARILTATGLEVEGVHPFESVKGGLEGVVVGKVLKKWKHPDADRLNLTQVDLGNGEPLQIVCGAPNVEEGQKVLVATVGTTIYPQNGEEGMTMRKAKIRGQESYGMICAEDELGLGESHDGILVLPEDAPVGSPAAEYLGIYRDHQIEIGLTPNRTDAISHIGVARDLAAYNALHNQEKDTVQWPDVEELPTSDAAPVVVKVTAPDACPRYAGIVLEGVQVGDSPDWLKNRLQAIGLRPINNIVDVTNYVMHEMGQPLHAFDGSVVNGTVEVRLAKQGEKLVTLDGVERELDPSDLMICNASEPMCIAGVFGGEGSGVSEKTTSVFLESALFDSVFIRKTAKRHGLHTDASYRFERGVDPEITIKALKRAAALILEIAGGEIVTKIYDAYPNPIAPHSVTVSGSAIDKLLGLTIPAEKKKQILQSLDIEVDGTDQDLWTLSVPPYRHDVRTQADIAEEILRIYGFDQVPLTGKLSFSMINLPKDRSLARRKRVIELFRNAGFHQAMNNSLTSAGLFQDLKEYPEKLWVRILNPLSEDLNIMRPNLVFGLAVNAAWNINRKQEQVKLFEMGKTYLKTGNGIVEEQQLAWILSGTDRVESWRNQASDVYFASMTEELDRLMSCLGIEGYTVKRTDKSWLSTCGEVRVGKRSVGFIGRLNGNANKRVGLDQPLYAAELSWDALLDLMPEGTSINAIPKFPAVRRDLALLIDDKSEFGEIERIAFQRGGDLLKEVSLFDVYEGKNLPAGKVSYAVKFILQDPEQTLTDKRVDKTMDKILNGLTKELGATLRA